MRSDRRCRRHEYQIRRTPRGACRRRKHGSSACRSRGRGPGQGGGSDCGPYREGTRKCRPPTHVIFTRFATGGAASAYIPFFIAFHVSHISSHLLFIPLLLSTCFFHMTVV